MCWQTAQCVVIYNQSKGEDIKKSHAPTNTKFEVMLMTIEVKFTIKIENKKKKNPAKSKKENKQGNSKTAIERTLKLRAGENEDIK